MPDLRQQWIELLREHERQPNAPAGELWAPQLEAAPRSRLRDIQSEKLVLAARFLYEFSPLTRERFDASKLQPADIRSVDDLAKIPIMTKQAMAEDLERNPPWGTYTTVDDDVWRRSGWQIFASSGTTARSRAFRYTAVDREMWAWLDARAMWAMGFRPNRDSAMLAFGYGPHVFMWGVHYALDRMGIPIVTAGGLDSRGRARFIDTYRPTILVCTPSYSLYLASVCRDLGIDPATSSINYVFTGGEPGYGVPATRQRIESAWGAELHEFYGCTEAAPSAGGYTCSSEAKRKEGPSGTHLMEDSHIWEVVDPNSLQPLVEGARGLSVCTNICSESSPQLRFLIGDFTTLTSAPCACGRTHVRALGGFIGRADDMLNVRGVTLFPSALEDVIRGFEELGEEFQIALSTERDLDVLTVTAEPLPHVAASDHDRLAQRLDGEIRSRCELRAVVQLVPYGTLPKTEFKAKRVKDLR